MIRWGQTDPKSLLTSPQGNGAICGNLGMSSVGGFDIHQALRRPGESLQVVDVDHRGHVTTLAGEEDRPMVDTGVADVVGDTYVQRWQTGQT